jgi:YVTN family beta-propeller protein
LLAAAITGIVLTTGGNGSAIVATKNSLAVVDPEKNEVVGVVPIGSTPRGVTVGAGHVWTANAGDGTVTEIDPGDLHVVKTIGLGSAATDLVEAAGQIWVATGSDDTVIRIDARSGGVLGTIHVPPDFQSSAYTIATGSGAVWLGSGGDIYKIDPTEHTTAGRFHYAGGINSLAFAGGSVWAASSAETVVRMSAATLRPTGEASLGVIPTAIAIGAGSIWVAAPAPSGVHAAVWRLEPVTARVTQTTTLEKVVGFPPTLEIAFGEGAVWVASYDAGIVTRLDPVTGNIVATIHVGGHPSGIAVGAKRIWVTVS